MRIDNLTPNYPNKLFEKLSNEMKENEAKIAARKNGMMNLGRCPFSRFSGA